MGPKCLTAARCRRGVIGVPRPICPRESGWKRSNARCPRSNGRSSPPVIIGRARTTAGQAFARRQPWYCSSAKSSVETPDAEGGQRKHIREHENDGGDREEQVADHHGHTCTAY